MNLSTNSDIALCQPDNTKGCSLCCGLFNFIDISPCFLSGFLEKGKSREKNFSTHDEYTISDSTRDKFSHICPYQGFLKTGKPGCLVHPLSSGADGRDRSLFASKICDKFFCPAHTILTSEEKFFLIESVSNWHLYSAAIADPESYSFIYNYVKNNFNFSENNNLFRFLVNEGLSAHVKNLETYEGILFCYSIPEYNIHKKNFCIRYIDKKTNLVTSHINKSAALFK